MSQPRELGFEAIRTSGAALLLALGLSASALGAEPVIGGREYTHYCAGCHGEGGEGAGPIAEYFGVTPPPLTRLAAENGGRFPLERVYRTIDGRHPVKAHGTGEMQVFGRRYSSEIDDIAIDAPDAVRESLRARLVRGRILELIYYLLTIQKD